MLSIYSFSWFRKCWIRWRAMGWGRRLW